MKEIWENIIGYEGVYQISNYGVVKSLERVLPPDGVHSKCHRKERILKGSKDRASNLEWATRGENQLHAYATGLKIPAKSTRGGKWNKRSIPVLQIFGNGEAKKWSSMGDAARALRLSRGNIWMSCNSELKCGGFKWRYAS